MRMIHNLVFIEQSHSSKTDRMEYRNDLELVYLLLFTPLVEGKFSRTDNPHHAFSTQIAVRVLTRTTQQV